MKKVLKTKLANIIPALPWSVTAGSHAGVRPRGVKEKVQKKKRAQKQVPKKRVS
jgi:hypothetical protein